MVSDTLRNKRLHDIDWEDEKKWFNAKATTMIDVQVRRLVMLMRSIELDGVMGFLDIENAVIQAFENAEHLYYGMSEDEFSELLGKEVANEKARSREAVYLGDT